MICPAVQMFLHSIGFAILHFWGEKYDLGVGLDLGQADWQTQAW